MWVGGAVVAECGIEARKGQTRKNFGGSLGGCNFS